MDFAEWPELNAREDARIERAEITAMVRKRAGRADLSSQEDRAGLASQVDTDSEDELPLRAVGLSEAYRRHVEHIGQLYQHGLQITKKFMPLPSSASPIFAPLPSSRASSAELCPMCSERHYDGRPCHMRIVWCNCDVYVRWYETYLLFNFEDVFSSLVRCDLG